MLPMLYYVPLMEAAEKHHPQQDDVAQHTSRGYTEAHYPS